MVLDVGLGMVDRLQGSVAQAVRLVAELAGYRVGAAGQWLIRLNVQHPQRP